MISNQKELAEALAHPREYEHRHIGQILFQSGIINASQLKEAIIEQQQKSPKERMGQIIKRMGFASDHQIRQALSCCLEIPYVHLADFDINPNVLKLVPAEFARAHSLMPIMLHKNHLVVAMEDPSDAETLNMLHFISGHVILHVLSSAEEIDYAISQYYGSTDIEDVLNTLPIHTETSSWEEQQAIKLATDRPTVRLINNLILDAVTRKASDIHIRPGELEVDILFRVDGSLRKIRSFDKKLLPAAVARIKIISGMNIAEHRLPQDGRTKTRHKDKEIDLRISIIPTIHGESVVLRILDTSSSLKSIKTIGFTPKDTELFSQMVQRSSGLLLVTGPTGSGKTTTLYAALQEIKKRDINIITVEDPVEYHMPGILQIQVNPAIHFTFAKALRNILRHDPDAIMLGEIRDEETAKMAVESALTGHLVLSTLHTNSAAATITRLLEIGIQSYLLNSTLLAVLAQRLVKRNCPHCLQEEHMASSMRKSLNIKEEEIFYKGSGCEKCHNTGYKGRVAVYELLEVNAAVRQLIQPGAYAKDIEHAAIESGMVPLTQHALNLAREKITSLEEVFRVRLN